MITDTEIASYTKHGIVPPLSGIEQWLKRRDEQATVVEAMHHIAMGRKTILCPKCFKRSQIGKITVIDIMVLVPSYNSYEDPYYSLQNTQCECPKCEARLELHEYIGNGSERWNQYPMKKFFKNIIEEYRK